MERIEGPDARR